MSRAENQMQMVDRQLARRGIADALVLDAFRSVPRAAFVPDELLELAYEDAPLPIGSEQTISQPYIVALTIEALRLKGGERVLEIGTGSGYAAALLSRIAKEVVTVERLETLAASARERLLRLHYNNIQVVCGDGTLGFAERAPYDAIAVAAGGPQVPEALLAQLAEGGRLVMPVGPRGTSQVLVRVTRQAAGFQTEPLTQVRFVPLIGQQGWPDAKRAPRVARKPTTDSAAQELLRETEPLSDLGSRSCERTNARRGADRDKPMRRMSPLHSYRGP